MTIPSRQAAKTLEAAPAARIVSGMKVYGTGAAAVRALDAISANFGAGQFTAIMGCPDRESRPCCIAWRAWTG